MKLPELGPKMAVFTRALPALIPVVWALAVSQTGRWPSGDGPHALGTAMRLAQQLRDLQLATFAWCFQSLLGPHPPLAYAPATLAYALLGPGRFVHLVAGGLAMGLCLDGVRRLGGGVVGMVFVLATGLVWSQAESYTVDLLAAAAVCQALSWLAASERLSLPKPAALWGLWMGVAFLTKYTAPMFLWAPCVVAGVWTLQGRRWRTLGAAFAAFAVVALPWYLSHLGEVAGYLGASTDAGNTLLTNKSLQSGPWYGAERLSWYPAVILDAYGWQGAAALALGVAVWPRQKHAPPGAWVLPLLGALGGLWVLTTQIQRQDRYLLPALPLLAAMLGSSRARWVSLPVGIIGVYGAAAMYLLPTEPPASRRYEHSLQAAGRGWPWPHEAFRPTSLDPAAWELDDALARLRAQHGSDEGTVGFLLDEAQGAPGYGLVLSRATAMGARWHIATVMVQGGGPTPPNDGGQGEGGPGGGLPGAAVFVGPFTTDAWPSRRFDTMLVIMREGDGRIQGWLDGSGFVEVEAWTLPRGLVGRVYKRSGS